MIKSCIVIGAGNAGRPVARLLNNQGMDVTTNHLFHIIHSIEG